MQQQFNNRMERLAYARKLINEGWIEAYITLGGGVALMTFGVLIWGIGTYWLILIVGWVGLLIQVCLSLIEFALILKLREDYKTLTGLALFVAIDAGSNTIGVRGFIYTWLAPNSQVGNLSFLGVIVVTIIIVAFVTYSPEKFVTLGAEMAVEGLESLEKIKLTALKGGNK